jgi:hypothetical protein
LHDSLRSCLILGREQTWEVQACKRPRHLECLEPGEDRHFPVLMLLTTLLSRILRASRQVPHEKGRVRSLYACYATEHQPPLYGGLYRYIHVSYILMMDGQARALIISRTTRNTSHHIDG